MKKMIILSIKTDQPLAEIGLFENQKKLGYIKWQSHRQLSVAILQKIESLLKRQNLSWGDIGGIVFYSGPGSYTGLRIGASVANALATSLKIPLASKNTQNWLNQGIKGLLDKKGKRLVIPEYGSPPKTTIPKK